MPLENTNPTTTKAWKKLSEHYQKTKELHLKTLFEEDPGRAQKFTRQWQDFLVDFSKNRITSDDLKPVDRFSRRGTTERCD